MTLRATARLSIRARLHRRAARRRRHVPRARTRTREWQSRIAAHRAPAARTKTRREPLAARRAQPDRTAQPAQRLHCHARVAASRVRPIMMRRATAQLSIRARLHRRAARRRRHVPRARTRTREWQSRIAARRAPAARIRILRARQPVRLAMLAVTVQPVRRRRCHARAAATRPPPTMTRQATARLSTRARLRRLAARRRQLVPRARTRTHRWQSRTAAHRAPPAPSRRWRARRRARRVHQATTVLRARPRRYRAQAALARTSQSV